MTFTQTFSYKMPCSRTNYRRKKKENNEEKKDQKKKKKKNSKFEERDGYRKIGTRWIDR